MPAYTIHLDQGEPDPDKAIDQMVLVPEKFSVWAFGLGPIWLIYHRLWAAFAGWFFLIILLVVAGIALKAPGTVILAVIYMMNFLLGLEGHNLRRIRLQKRGYHAVDVAAGKNAEEAEHRFLIRRELSTLAKDTDLQIANRLPATNTSVPQYIGGLLGPEGAA